jgi:hypothetical protein
VRKALKQLLKRALTLSTATFLIGCNSQSPKAQSKQSPEAITQPIIPIALKSAIEELRVMKIKVKDSAGVSKKEYGEDLADLVNITQKAYGNPKALAAVKSAVEGHQLALKFWECDRAVGYEELHQCQDEVLKGVFAKYPDIEAQAKAAVAGENLPYISAGLDKDAMLQAIWDKTAQDTEAALQVINPPPKPKES